MWVQSGPLAIGSALGFDKLVADVYWIRAVIYYGGQRHDRSSGDANYDLLYPLLDLVTSLDPHFIVAYRFGAIFLDGPTRGPGRPDLAIHCCRRGIENDSGRWEYSQDIGFVYYWWLRDSSRRGMVQARRRNRARRSGWRRWPRRRGPRAAIDDRRGSLEADSQNTENEWMRRNATSAYSSSMRWTRSMS